METTRPLTTYERLNDAVARHLREQNAESLSAVQLAAYDHSRSFYTTIINKVKRVRERAR